MRKLSSGAVLCAGLALSLAGVAQAQPYSQSTYPGGLGNDAARGGVLITQDGGTISVGESQSFGSDYDVYVVKTDECGFLQWSTTYDLGGGDFGRKIRQTEDGGYIIVGTTENRNSCCKDEKSFDNDIFLLRIDAKGGIVWSKTYGGSSHDEGTDVQLYFGEGYVVTGNTQSFGDGKINGYLMKTDLDGNILWGRSYGQRDGAEIFNSCAVSTSGDILVTGATYSFGTSVLAMRTDANGFINWAEFFPYKGSTTGRHIIETSDETIVIGGWANTIETNTLDCYLLRLRPDGTFMFDQAITEGNGQFPDEIAEVRETFDQNLVFTGYMTDAPGGFGGRDLLLGMVDYKFNSQWISLHGEARDDEGYSVAFSPEFSKKYGSVYTVANGVTQSFTKKGEDLYLVQAIKNGYTGCYDAHPKYKEFRLNLEPKQISYCHPLAMAQCRVKVGSQYNDWQNILCSWCKFELRQNNGGDPDLGHLDRDQRLNEDRNGSTRVDIVRTEGPAPTIETAR